MQARETRARTEWKSAMIEAFFLKNTLRFIYTAMLVTRFLSHRLSTCARQLPLRQEDVVLYWPSADSASKFLQRLPSFTGHVVLVDFDGGSGQW